MNQTPLAIGQTAILSRDGLQALIDGLIERRYRVIGPTVRDGAIVYDDIAGVQDLPAGWTDRQAPGSYRLERRDDQALFGYAVGPQSWKRFLHPPLELLFTAHLGHAGMTIEGGEGSEEGSGEGGGEAPQAPEQFAFVGVRACELHAIAIQDRVFQEGAYVDQGYASRRAGAFIVALNCGTAGGTCFCASMQTGPKADAGFDLALTELHPWPEESGTPDAAGGDFLVEVGSEAGAALLGQVPHGPPSDAQLAAARAIVARTAGQMGRTMHTDGIKALLQDNPGHPRWAEVADRCLSCGNCTMVCPTCFCTTVEDHSDLAGASAQRVRRWDSCFTLDFSYIHGGSVRHTTQARYRQWLTHKLANWIDQFGTSGCVGCGRCITWCPVGIDITEEIDALRGAAEPAQRSSDGDPHGGT